MAHKLGIVGIGHVGSHVLTQAMNSELFAEIAVVDPREDLVVGQVLDQVHATGLHTQHNVTVHSNEYSELKDADVIIISATHVYPYGENPGDRQELLVNNVPVFKDVIEKIMEQTTDAILIWITNPVDTAVYMSSEVFGYPREKVLGTGTLLDSSRLKYTLGKHYGVSPNSVSAFMIGEHGYTALATLSTASVAGIPYHKLSKHFPDIDPLSLEEVSQEIVNAAYYVFDNKNGVTDIAIGQVALAVARSILLDEKAVYPVTSYVPAGTYGASESFAVGTPSIVGKNGVEKVFEVELAEEELPKMQKSVEAILASIKLGKELAEKNK